MWLALGALRRRGLAFTQILSRVRPDLALQRFETEQLHKPQPRCSQCHAWTPGPCPSLGNVYLAIWSLQQRNRSRMPLSRSLQWFSTDDVMGGAMHYLQVRDVACRVAAQRQERTSERGAKCRKAGSGVALPVAGVQPRNRRN